MAAKSVVHFCSSMRRNKMHLLFNMNKYIFLKYIKNKMNFALAVFKFVQIFLYVRYQTRI